MLPPERIQQTFLPLWLNFLYIRAATVDAAAPSVMILLSSRRVKIAEEISPQQFQAIFFPLQLSRHVDSFPVFQY